MTSDASADVSPPERPSADAERNYVVVARRYRPQTFEDLIGQQSTGQALQNAIETNRVGHAYLFTGARGVGKTSAARIFAKALNCVDGPAPKPCNQCDICQSVSLGEDIDVLEIDGASNRGIDEIRQLRSNVNIRPSRCRYKIYIIDEVHMLTKEAFNALLKTLEEPPGHVKFIFCTTDPEKMPITVLSRCQRFDFSPVEVPAIAERLRQIVEAEGAQAEPEALDMLARRANGSMRDSQSLLEQLLSFGGTEVTLASVHEMLGTAQSGRLMSLIGRLVGRDAAGAITELDAAVAEGVDAGQLIEQLLGCYRDMMAAAVGCSPDAALHSTPADFATLADWARQLGLETVLAAVQILDQTLTQMRQSVQVRTLAEVALVRVCKLENLDELAALIGQLKSGQPAAAAPARASVAGSGHKKKAPVAARAEPPQRADPAPAENSSPPANPAPQVKIAISAETAEPIFKQALASLGDMTAEQAGQYASVQAAGANQMAVVFPAKYTSSKTFCERPDRLTELERAVSAVTGGPVRLAFQVESEPAASSTPSKPTVSPQQRMREVVAEPIVQQAIDLFGAEVTRVDESRRTPERR